MNWKCKHTWRQSANNTKWCLLGCSIGDFGTIFAFQLFAPEVSMWIVMPLAIFNGLLTSIILETVILMRQAMDFKSALDTAFKMIQNSETNKMIFYIDKKGKKTRDYEVQDYYKSVLFNYGKTIINNEQYEIDLLSKNQKNYKGKIWNICLTNPINECYKPNQKINILNENFLQGGLKLDLWEIK